MRPVDTLTCIGYETHDAEFVGLLGLQKIAEFKARNRGRRDKKALQAQAAWRALVALARRKMGRNAMLRFDTKGTIQPNAGRSMKPVQLSNSV